MEQWKSAGESHLDLESQYSIMEFVDPDGRRKIIIRKPDGKKELEAIYDRQGQLLESRKFSDNEQDQVFTDPETLAEVDKQVRGLLGEKVEENPKGH